MGCNYRVICKCKYALPWLLITCVELALGKDLFLTGGLSGVRAWLMATRPSSRTPAKATLMVTVLSAATWTRRVRGEWRLDSGHLYQLGARLHVKVTQKQQWWEYHVRILHFYACQYTCVYFFKIYFNSKLHISKGRYNLWQKLIQYSAHKICH